MKMMRQLVAQFARVCARERMLMRGEKVMVEGMAQQGGAINVSLKTHLYAAVFAAQQNKK